MNKKNIILIGILLVFGISIGFKDYFIRNFYQFCITSYCSHHFGSTPVIEKIYKEKDYWVFENITLQHETTLLKAKRLAFKYALEPAQLSLYLQFIIEDSLIDIMQEAKELRSAFEEIASKTLPLWLFKVHFDFSIDRGRIRWKEAFFDSSLPSDANFHLSASSSEGKKAFQLSLFLDPEEKAKNSLDLYFTSEKGLALKADAAFRKIDCSNLARLCELFDPSFLGVKVWKGSIDGTLHCDYQDRKKASTHGKLFLKELDLSHLKSACRFFAPELCLEFELKNGKEEMPHIFGRMFLDQGVKLCSSNESGIIADLQRGEGDFFFDFKEKDFDADLLFHDGNVKISGIFGKAYDFHHERSRIKVAKGLLEPFEIEGYFEEFPQEQLCLRGHLLVEDVVPEVQGTLFALQDKQESELLDFKFDLLEILSSKKVFPRGCVRTRALALEKYVWPLFFQDAYFKQQGSGIFNFTFEESNAFTAFEVQGESLSYRGNASIAFHPSNDFSVSGTLSDLEIPFKIFEAKLMEGSCCFGYESALNSLCISNFCASFLGNQGTNYQVSGEYLNVPDLRDGKLFFDFWVGDKTRDMIRLCGQAALENDEKLISRYRVGLDLSRSHFGTAEPTFFSCMLSPEWNVESFELGLWLDLKDFFHDRQFLQKFFPILKGASERRVSGAASVNIAYEGKKKEFVYELTSGPFAIDEYSFNRCALVGRKKENLWTIDRAGIDDYFLSGQAFLQHEILRVDRLKLLCQLGWEMNFRGTYNTREHSLDMALDSFFLDFQRLHHKNPTAGFDFEGLLTGSGRINGDFSEGLAFRKLEATLDLFLKAPGIVPAPPLHFFIQKMRFGRDFKEAHFDGICFEIPTLGVPWFMDLVKRKFHPLISDEIANTIKNIKYQNGLQGSVNYEYMPPYNAFQLTLKDGRYAIFGEEVFLKNFILEKDPFEFKMTGKFAYGDEDLSWYCRSIAADFSKGELVLLDPSLKSYDFGHKLQPLVVLWERNERAGMSVKRASGFFGGLDVDLMRRESLFDSSSVLELTGRVILHPEKVRIFLPPELIQKIVDWQIAGSYEFQGSWKFLKKTYDHCFSGKLSSHHFSIKGYQFDELSADVEWDPWRFNFSNLSMNDFSGKWSAETIHFDRKKDKSWGFFIPFIRVSDLNLRLLCKAGLPRLSNKNSFLVKDFALMNLSGSLNDCSSWKGNGFVNFTNKYRKGAKKESIDLPSNIRSHLDLDSGALIPTTGFIEYRIENGSIVLTKLKDVYSEGKLFKFSLSSSACQTIDFSGNLDLQFKIKQCNIFFKPVELCSFNIKGSLKKPLWVL